MIPLSMLFDALKSNKIRTETNGKKATNKYYEKITITCVSLILLFFQTLNN